MERGSIFYSSFVVKDMIIHFLTKVDGHLSRGNRDKYPEHFHIGNKRSDEQSDAVLGLLA